MAGTDDVENPEKTFNKPFRDEPQNISGKGN